MMPLLNQPIYIKMFGNIESRYPVAQHINRNGFIIGCHHYLTIADLDYVIKAFNNFFKKF
jgi:dTDP-4-amino-4,6-dideoxygalactose transaminase